MTIRVELPLADVEKLIEEYVKSQLGLDDCGIWYKSEITINTYRETVVILTPQERIRQESPSMVDKLEETENNG